VQPANLCPSLRPKLAMRKKQYIALVALLVPAIFLTALGWEFFLSEYMVGTTSIGLIQAHTEETRVWHAALTALVGALAILIVSGIAWPHLTARERLERALKKAHVNLERRFEDRAVALKREIAEREHIQRKLSEREAQYRNIIEGSTRGVVIHDGRGILFANQTAADILGYNAPEDIRLLQGLESFVAPNDHERLRDIISPRDDAGLKRILHELRAVRRNGDRIWLSWASRPIVWEGAPAIHSGFVDITDRKRTEDALRNSEARLAAILDLAPEGILSTDDRGIIQVFNQGAEAIFGYRAEEIIGQHLEALLPLEARLAHVRHMDEFNASSETKQDMCERREVRGLRKDGTIFAAEASVSKISVNGVIVYSAIVRDATERRAAQQAMHAAKTEAELANRAKTSFLASMSHELRTPLNAIIGFSEIISNEMFGSIDNDAYRNYARDIHDSGLHLLALINDVLDLSKVESGSAELWEEETAIPELVASVTKMLSARAQSKEIRLSTDVANNLPPILADSRKLKQILANLVSNAVKFTPPRGEVLVRASYSDSHGYAIDVRDTGIGMAKDDIPKALSPFQQIDSDLNRKFEGTGLGLPLTKALVALHGGTLDIESEPGEGTTVTVRLPAGRAIVGAARRNANGKPVEQDAPERRQFG